VHRQVRVAAAERGRPRQIRHATVAKQVDAPSPADEAAEVAKLVLSAIEPQLHSQQTEISKLATMVHKKPKAVHAHSGRAGGEEAEERAFDRRMSRFLGRRRRAAASTKMSNLNMVDYRLTNDIKHGEHDPGLGQEPPRPAGLDINITRPSWLPKAVARYSPPWRHPEGKGGPCSVAGACDHARFAPRDSEQHFRRKYLERYKDWTTDGSGGPVRHRPEYHSIEQHLAVGGQSGMAVLKALDFDAGSFAEKIPQVPKRNFVASVEGNLLVNKSGIYTFCSSSSDRSVLFVDSRKVVSNDGQEDRGALRPEKEECASIGLIAGLHPVRAVEFQAEKPVSFAATYSGPDTKGGKAALASAGWILRVQPSLPDLWDKWYATYAPRLDAVADDDIMANPLGEARLSGKELKDDILKPDIPDLPDKNYFVTVIGEITVTKNGAYEFCSPNKDGSVLFVDDRKALHCVHPTSDAEKRCGRLQLLRGKHSIKAAVKAKEPSDKGTFFTYSGPDTKYEAAKLESAGGWVVRAFGAPPTAWKRWYGSVCRRPQESVAFGDEELMAGLDDFIPPNDAYVHDQLTSGSYGYDHFGNLEPMSKENQELMYGTDYVALAHHIEGSPIHPVGRGGRWRTQRERVRLGDAQVGGDDREVPVKLSSPPYPGADPDHFDHWRWNSSLNQELLNGRYWKHLKRDGMTDRLTPVDEAYAQIHGGSHDRHPVADLFVQSWNLGHGYGPSKWGPASEAFAQADARLLSDRIGETQGPVPDLSSTTAIHQKVPGLPKENFVQVATGRVLIQKSGSYSFCTTGPSNPSFLFVDGSKVVVNDGSGSQCGVVGLAAGPHAVRAVALQATADGSFNATYSGADTGPANKTVGSPNATIPARPAWLLRAYRTTPEEWDEWAAVRSMSPERAARLWSERHPEPWVKGRQDTLGKAWRNKVFTGTHERIEDHRGIVQNTYHDDGAYF